jgi:hypothetical protein
MAGHHDLKGASEDAALDHEPTKTLVELLSVWGKEIERLDVQRCGFVDRAADQG